MTPFSHSPVPGRATRALASGAVVLSLTLGLGGCGDDPFALRWRATPEEAVIHSITGTDLNAFTAFNLIDRIPIRVEGSGSSGNWDIALDEVDAQLVFLPPGALGIFPADRDNAARILRLEGVGFDEVTEAPADTSLYSVSRPVPVATGSVYVVQTRVGADRFGRACTFYAKVEPLEVNRDQGTVRFLFDRNPICDDRDLVADEPAETEEEE